MNTASNIATPDGPQTTPHVALSVPELAERAKQLEGQFHDEVNTEQFNAALITLIAYLRSQS